MELPALRAVLAKTPQGEEVAARMAAFCGELAAAAGSNLASLVVFGGIARGRYRPERSDVNVLVVLEKAGAGELQAIGAALVGGWRAIRVEPMILTVDQIASAARAFPTKFLDIKEKHLRLAGRDVLAGLEVPRERILWRVEQELQNLSIRLRRRVAVADGDDALLARELAEIARPLAIELAWLLRMRGGAVPGEDRTAEIFRAAAQAFGLDGAALEELAGLRQNPRARAGLAGLGERVIGAMVTSAALAATTS